MPGTVSAHATRQTLHSTYSAIQQHDGYGWMNEWDETSVAKPASGY